jgi:hypothetical protein
LETTAPIRGLKPECIPLGERRYHNAFSIRKGEEGAVECLLYGRAIVIFKPDETITLISGVWDGRVRWGDVGEAYFIKNLLYYYVADAVMQERVVRITLRSGGQNKLALVAGVPVVVKPNEHQTLTLVSNARAMGWRINRSAANAVRKQYGDFYRYVKSMVALRVEDIHNLLTISLSIDEVQLAIPEAGEEERGTRLVNKYVRSNFLLYKPPIGVGIAHRWNSDTGKPDEFPRNRHAEWAKNMELFLTNVRDKGETQHESWHKAFVMLAYTCFLEEGRLAHDAASLLCRGDTLLKALDQILFQWHSSYVLEQVELAQGQVPNRHYESWVDRQLKT